MDSLEIIFRGCPITSRGGPYQMKPVVTCEFPGDRGPDPSPPLDPPMHLFSAFVKVLTITR